MSHCVKMGQTCNVGKNEYIGLNLGFFNGQYCLKLMKISKNKYIIVVMGQHESITVNKCVVKNKGQESVINGKRLKKTLVAQCNIHMIDHM